MLVLNCALYVLHIRSEKSQLAEDEWLALLLFLEFLFQDSVFVVAS